MVFNLFSERLQELIKQKGFLEPTLPQKLGIPEIIAGKNVLIIAPTGVGKTEASILALFDKIFIEKNKPISLLYITPLRSLNRDLLDRLCWWADKLDLDISVRHGDTSQKERNVQRELPPHVLITTPETLGAILPGKKMREHLKNIKYVIIDEIHELIESKRGVQLSVLLERLKEIAGDFQRIGLSATIGSPELVANFLGNNVKIIHAETEKKYDIRIEFPQPTIHDKTIADDLFIGVETTARLRKLYELIQSHKSVLVFTNTRETAEVLSSRLRQLDKELKQDVHHGSLSKERRIRSEQKFKLQDLKSLIATSSLELGIDIGSIDLVIQYLSPRQVTKLIQRVGRGGHRVGEISKGIILSGDEDLFESSIIARCAIDRLLEPIKIHETALDVLAMQIIGLSLEEYEINSNKIYSIIKNAYPYHNLEKNEFIEILKFLESLHLIWLNQKNDFYEIKRGKKSWKYYFENLSTIPDTKQYKIISVIENEPIGNLDEEFIAEHGMIGNKFICSGRAWRIIQIIGNKVMVEPIEDIESAIPAWEGELIPVPFDIAQYVGRLRRFISENIDDKNIIQKLKEKYNIDTNSAKGMIEIIKKQKDRHIVPDDKTFLIENYKDFIILHSCCGSLVNDTIGKYIAACITAETGVAVNIKTDPYRIMIQTVAKPEEIKKILENAKNLEDVLTTSLERSTLFKHRFIQVAKRFGIISKSAQYDKININKIISIYTGTPAYKETLREIFLEKMDIEKSKEIIEKIRSGNIKIKIQEGLSILGELGLTQQFSEVLKPKMPEKEIFEAFKRRLLSTRVRLLCVNCGEYNIIKPVREIEEQPECPKCSSRLIAILRKSQINAVNIVKKKLKKKELTKDEIKEFQSIRRSADLTIVYGKRAALVMAGHGIGPQTAARILSCLHPTKEKLLKDIFAAEKEFLRTKPYWK
ncbi:MAG: DEAD/DEAH box helicase [Candidatus Aenigmatarchaeota archaeon]